MPVRGTINWQVLLLGDMSFQDFGDCTFGLTTRTGKCVKMVYGLQMWGTFFVFQMCALPIECLFGAGGKWWQSDRRWRTCWQDLRTITGLKSWLHQDVSALWLIWCNVNGGNHPWLLFEVFIGVWVAIGIIFDIISQVQDAGGSIQPTNHQHAAGSCCKLMRAHWKNNLFATLLRTYSLMQDPSGSSNTRHSMAKHLCPRSICVASKKPKSLGCICLR